MKTKNKTVETPQKKPNEEEQKMSEDKEKKVVCMLSAINDIDEHIKAIETNKIASYFEKKYYAFRDQAKNNVEQLRSELKNLKDNIEKEKIEYINTEIQKIDEKRHYEIERNVIEINECINNESTNYSYINVKCDTILDINRNAENGIKKLTKESKTKFNEKLKELRNKIKEAREKARHIKTNKENIIDELKQTDIECEIDVEALKKQKTEMLVTLKDFLNSE